MACSYKGKSVLYALLSDFCKVHEVELGLLKRCVYGKYRGSEWLKYSFYLDDILHTVELHFLPCYISFELKFHLEEDDVRIKKWRYVFYSMDELYRHIEQKKQIMED